jgi:hypothetical protein
MDSGGFRIRRRQPWEEQVVRRAFWEEKKEHRPMFCGRESLSSEGGGGTAGTHTCREGKWP